MPSSVDITYFMVILFYHYYSRRRLTHQRTNLEKVLKEQKDVVDNTSSVTSSANLEFSDAVSSAVISADVLPNTYRSKNARVLPVPSNAYPDGSLGHPHQHRVRRSVRHLNVLRRHIFSPSHWPPIHCTPSCACSTHTSTCRPPPQQPLPDEGCHPKDWRLQWCSAPKGAVERLLSNCKARRSPLVPGKRAQEFTSIPPQGLSVQVSLIQMRTRVDIRVVVTAVQVASSSPFGGPWERFCVGNVEVFFPHPPPSAAPRAPRFLVVPCPTPSPHPCPGVTLCAAVGPNCIA